MPKSDILPLRRWPCWPGPYSRRLTGLLGRPKTFSPMRRSSLYLALVRLVTSDSPICFHMCPDRTTSPSDWRDHRFTGRAGSIASGALRQERPRGQIVVRFCAYSIGRASYFGRLMAGSTTRSIFATPKVASSKFCSIGGGSSALRHMRCGTLVPVSSTVWQIFFGFFFFPFARFSGREREL